MNSFSDVIDAFGYVHLAHILGKPIGTVSSWRSRDYIPSEFWLTIVREAHGRIHGVTLELLARLSAERARAARDAPSRSERVIA